MKKNIIGLFAVAIAIGASAFTVSPKKVIRHNVNLKWFIISGNYAPTASVPSASATYISGADGSTAPEEADACEGSTRQCVSGFDPSKVTMSNTLNGSQTADDATALRNQ